MTTTETMTRPELIADCAADLTERWGAEHADEATTTAAKKSTPLLRVERQMRLGEEITAGRQTNFIAGGCLDAGYS